MAWVEYIIIHCMYDTALTVVKCEQIILSGFQVEHEKTRRPKFHIHISYIYLMRVAKIN